MGSPRQQRLLIAQIRAADREQRDAEGEQISRVDELLVETLADGRDPMVARVLAFACRSAAVFDAMSNIVQARRLEEQIARGSGRA